MYWSLGTYKRRRRRKDSEHTGKPKKEHKPDFKRLTRRSPGGLRAHE
jgi:hypothetical protein